MAHSERTITRNLEEAYSQVREMQRKMEQLTKEKEQLEETNKRLFIEINEMRNPVPTFDEARAYSADAACESPAAHYNRIQKEEKARLVPHVNVVRHTFECSENDRITLTIEKA